MPIDQIFAWVDKTDNLLELDLASPTQMIRSLQRSKRLTQLDIDLALPG